MNKTHIHQLEQAAQAALQKGLKNKALILRSKAIRLAVEHKQLRLAAVLLNRLGKIYEADSQPFQAVLAFEKGLQVLQESTIDDLEEVLKSKRRASKGFSSTEDAFPLPDLIHPDTVADLAKAEKDPALAAYLLINSANSYLNRKQYAAAQRDYQLALQQKALSYHPKLQLLAASYLTLIEHRQGKSVGEKIDTYLSTAHAQDWEVELAFLHGIKADLLAQEGNIKAAAEQYEYTASLFEQGQNKIGKARLLLRYGDLLIQQKAYQKAHTTFSEAAILGERFNDRVSKWWAYAALGEVAMIREQWPQGIEFFQKSIKHIEVYRKSLGTEEGKVSFVQSVQEIYDRLIICHVALDKHEQALETAEQAKSRALLDLTRGRKRRRRRNEPRDLPPTASSPFSEDFIPPSNIASSISSPPPMAQMAIGVESASAIPSFLSSDFAGEEDLMEKIEAKPLARLVYHVLADRLLMWFVEATGKIHAHVGQLSASSLRAKVEALRDALLVDQAPLGLRSMLIRKQTEKPQAYQAILTALFQDLVQPFWDQIVALREPLVLEAHDLLWQLPFAALRTSDGRAFGELVAIMYTPSHAWLHEIRTEPSYGAFGELSALLVGNPSMPPPYTLDGVEVAFESLTGAETEVNYLQDAFGKQAYKLVNEAATKPEVIHLMREHQVIHLATHGITWASNPLKSFLILAGRNPQEAMLTAKEVFDLELSAELVTLSACQTGLGQLSAEGIIGLSRAFIAAGARSVLVSLWNVNDEATCALMRSFYQHLLAGTRKAEALKLAIAELKANGDYAHPRYWVGFCLIGEG